MPPLPPEEREKNLAEQRQQEAVETELPAGSDSDGEHDDGALSQQAERERIQQETSLEAQQAQELELLALKENLKQRNEQAVEMLAAQKKAKEAFDRIQKLKAEVLSLDKEFQGFQQQTEGIQKEMEQQQPLDLSGMRTHQQMSLHPGNFPGAVNQQQPGAPGGLPGVVMPSGTAQQQLGNAAPVPPPSTRTERQQASVASPHRQCSSSSAVQPLDC